MNTTDFWFQMTQMTQQLQGMMNAMGGAVGNAGSGQDFQTLLEDKRTETDHQKPTQSKPDHSTDKTPSSRPSQTDESKEPVEQEGVQEERPMTQEEYQQRLAMLQAGLAFQPVIPLVTDEQPAQAVLGMDLAAVALQPQGENLVEGMAQMPQTVEGELGAHPMESASLVEQPVTQQPVTQQQTTQPPNPVDAAPQEQGPVAQEQPQATQQVGTGVQPETGEQGLSATAPQGEQDSDLTGNRQEPELDAQVQSTVTGQTEAPHQEGEAVKVGTGETLDVNDPQMDSKLNKVIQQAVQQGQQKVELQLTPEHLGRIRIEMTRTDSGMLQVVIQADNEQTAHLLREHASTLTNLLQGSNQGEVRVQITQPHESEAQQWQQPDQDQGRGNSQNRERRQQQEDSEQFLQQLRLGLLSES